MNGEQAPYANETVKTWCHEAADDIRKLWDENKRLREALHTIGYGPPRMGNPTTLLNTFVSLARAALAGEKP